MNRRGGQASAKRGQSSVVGVVLVFALVILTMTITVAVGHAALSDTQDQLSEDRAELAMTQLDSQIAGVALGRSNLQSLEIGSEADGYTLDESAGRMTVEVGGTTKLDTDMGAITYDQGGATIAYQGGGVWKANRDGEARMVSPPEFHYRDATLTLPLVVVEGDSSVSDTLYVEDKTRTQHWPSGSDTNPVSGGTVTVTVESAYADAWANYFEERTEGTVTYPAPDTVELELTVPTSSPSISGAMVGQSTGSMDLKSNTLAKKYDSSTAGHTHSSGVDVYYEGDVDIKNNAEIHGDVHSNGEITNKGTIHGDAYHENGYNENGGSLGGSEISGATIPDPSNVNSLISSTTYGTAGPAAMETQSCPCTLTAGDYQLSEIDVDSEVILDTSSGEIDMKVQNGIELGGGANIKVQGPNRVNIYNAGGLDMGNSAKVTDDSGDYEAPNFWIYMRDDSSSELKQGTEYTGVIYAPGQSGGGTIKLKNGGEIHGAVVGDINDAKAKKEFYYDEALASADTIPSSATGSMTTITYLHVSTNTVEVSD
jgi:hypothetical protein